VYKIVYVILQEKKKKKKKKKKKVKTEIYLYKAASIRVQYLCGTPHMPLNSNRPSEQHRTPRRLGNMILLLYARERMVIVSLII
jgi:hypothetical protein